MLYVYLESWVYVISLAVTMPALVSGRSGVEQRLLGADTTIVVNLVMMQALHSHSCNFLHSRLKCKSESTVE